MTIPTPTEGIEPTIRRIAEDVCREYLGSILGLCLGKQKAPQEPAPVEESEAVRKAREEERAKVNAEWQTGSGYQSPEAILEMHGRAVDRAVHQARVDALGLDTPWREQSMRSRPCRNQQPTTPDSVAAVTAIADAAHSRLASMGRTECECCDQWVALEDTFPGRVMGCGPFCSQCRPWWASSPSNHFGEGCPHDGSKYRKQAKTARSAQPIAPAEAKGAPERADDGGALAPETLVIGRPSGALCWYLSESYRAAGDGKSADYVRADVVERRVAETGSAARIQAALSTRHVLQAAGDEDTQDAARRVVAERDAAEAKAKANYDEGMKHYLRAEAAEARVWELEHDKACTEESLSALHRELSSRHAEKESAESELARVRAELAEANQAIDTLHGDIARIKSRRARSTDATGG